MTTQKRITITADPHKRWSVEFEGTITNRDIQKLYRIIKVEFAKVQRRRTARKLLTTMTGTSQNATGNHQSNDQAQTTVSRKEPASVRDE